MLISIIIPIYNTERYLPKLFTCLDRQSYEDIELIFVNDGSKDRTAVYLEQYREEKRREEKRREEKRREEKKKNKNNS